MKRPRRKDNSHLEFIRGLPCLVTGTNVGIDAAHIRGASIQWGKRHTGMGEKPSDIWVVPLSRGQHEIQHFIGEHAYWNGCRIDPYEVAAALWVNTGDHETAEAILAWHRERATLIKGERT